MGGGLLLMINDERKNPVAWCTAPNQVPPRVPVCSRPSRNTVVLFSPHHAKRPTRAGVSARLAGEDDVRGSAAARGLRIARASARREERTTPGRRRRRYLLRRGRTRKA